MTGYVEAMDRDDDARGRATERAWENVPEWHHDPLRDQLAFLVELVRIAIGDPPTTHGDDLRRLVELMHEVTDG